MKGGAAAPLIQEKLRAGLRVIFVGFNPSITSHERGLNYAGRNNRFYRILYESGLTARLYTPEESPHLLEDYGYGFTNLVARPTKRADELTAEEYREGARILREKLKQYRPRVACYVGKGVYERYSGRRKVQWGFQAEPVLEGVMDFVGPSSSGLVRMTLAEQVSIYAELTKFMQYLKEP
jgi:TDG/mug DNA glycosylase family protein